MIWHIPAHTIVDYRNGREVRLPESWAISSHQVWLPGAYSSERAARYAFRFDRRDLQVLQDRVNETTQERAITFEMLQELAREKRAVATTTEPVP